MDQSPSPPEYSLVSVLPEEYDAIMEPLADNGSTASALTLASDEDELAANIRHELGLD
jgi:hypothetical protein